MVRSRKPVYLSNEALFGARAMIDMIDWTPR